VLINKLTPRIDMTLPQNNIIGPIELARNCIENGRNDEALVHLDMACNRLSKVMISEDQSNIFFPDKVNRFEVIDHGLTNGLPRCFVTNTAKGGEISIQDSGRTVKLFLVSE
jgi:hypothetical protein